MSLALRVLTDVLIGASILGLGVLAKAFADGGIMIAGNEIPWSALILGAISVVTSGLTLMLKAQVSSMHVTFNSKMDLLLATATAKAKAEGVLEEKERTNALNEAKVAGAAEEKGRTP